MTPTPTLSIPFFDYRREFAAEEQELVEVFRDTGRRGAFILQDDLHRFEGRLAEFAGARHAIGVGNATDGLILTLRAAGIGAGDEVVFCAHTMVATAAAIHFAGAIPVPVDCGADHLIDPAAAAAAITPRTRALLPTQLNGRTADMEALLTLAQRHGLTIVEDAAQSLGSSFRGQTAGTFGAGGAISFYPAKVLGCLGDGGAVLTDDPQVFERLEQLRDHGRNPAGEIVSWGLNSRLDNLQAAILDRRLARLPSVIARRRAIARLYRARLAGLEELKLPPGPDGDPGHFDVFQNYEIEAAQRDDLRKFLTSRGIGTLLPWGGKAVHQWGRLGFRVRLPFTEALFERLLLLPMNLGLADDEVHAICDTIHEFYRSRSGAALERWRMMFLIRRAEETIARMVETGEVRCPCHLSIGQEAIAAGVCAALRREDSVWGGHRSHGHYLAKGGSLEGLFAEILGKTTGCSGGRGGSMHLFAPDEGILGTVPIVAATVPLAAGAALAYKMRGEKRVAVAFFGDGTLEEGHVYETFNLASLYRLPLVFVCENNLYASHLHWTERRVADNLDQAGAFHSIPGQRVDGNDVEAVFLAASEAVERARDGGGPALLELRTFRWRGHVGASFDVDVGCQRRDELSAWLPKDPIQSGEAMETEKQVIEEKIACALDAARRASEPSAGRVLEHVCVP